MRDDYYAALLRAAAASGPESMLEVGAENPELAEAIRTSLSAQGMAAPSPVNTEVPGPSMGGQGAGGSD
jgi:hypothetical protein